MEVTGLDQVLRNLGEYERNMHDALHDAGEEIGHYLANYAKTHHLWMPQTGATDVSTVGQIVQETRDYVLVALSAGMSYNVFLELAHEGRWAWLWPAVVDSKDEIVSILARHLRGVTV